MRTEAIGVDELRDIHLPPDLHWFQPAPLTWLLLMACVVVIATGLFRWQQRQRAADPSFQAHQQLEKAFTRWRSDGNKQAYLHHAASTLKLLAIQQGQRKTTARLTGRDWVDWLNTQRSSKHVQTRHQSLGSTMTQALASELYQQDPRTDIEQLHQELSTWLKHSNTPKHA